MTLASLDAHDLASALATRAPLVVDVGAGWCAPCKRYEPIFDEAAARWSGRARFVRMDADANPDLATRYGVGGLPTTLVFRDGRLVDRIVGLVAPAALEDRLRAALS